MDLHIIPMLDIIDSSKSEQGNVERSLRARDSMHARACSNLLGVVSHCLGDCEEIQPRHLYLEFEAEST